MKNYTNIEQSKKLAEFLPLESADMHWQYVEEDNRQLQWFCFPKDFSITQHNTLSAWSLAALYDILPDGTNIIKNEADTENEKYMCVAETKDDIISTFGNNPVDACVDMILKLKEKDIL